MKIIIDLPEETYKEVKIRGTCLCPRDEEALCAAIRKSIPYIEPKQKTGYWDYDGYCSECGGDPMDFIDTMGATYDAYIETPMPYCPHCGAKMEGTVDVLDYIHKPIKERLKDREALLAKQSALERGKDE